MFDTIEACTKPVIAAVQGAAMGGGLLLTLVADACLASEHAKFGAPEVKLGFFPNLRLIPRLERIVGARAAKHLVLTGDPVSASTALDWGLVERVLPSQDLHAEAQALAEQLAALPPFAVQSAKAAFGAIHTRTIRPGRGSDSPSAGRSPSALPLWKPSSWLARNSPYQECLGADQQGPYMKAPI